MKVIKEIQGTHFDSFFSIFLVIDIEVIETATSFLLSQSTSWYNGLSVYRYSS